MTMVAAMVVSMMLGGLAAWASRTGWFVYFLAGEILLAAVFYLALYRALARRRWLSLE